MIINRENDPSGQKEEYQFVSSAAAATGASVVITPPIPYPYVIENLRIACFGCSGAIAVRPLIARFIAGAGATNAIIAGTTFAAGNFGTSGILGTSLFNGGSTLAVGQAGDLIALDFVGANTAIANYMVNVIVRKTQDIVQYYGI